MEEDFFINIEMPQGVLTCYNAITEIKRKRVPLRPAFCLDILRATNNAKVIGALCAVMAEQADDYAAYRKAWLGLVAKREVKPEVWETVRETALANDDGEGFAKATALADFILLAGAEQRFALDLRRYGDNVKWVRGGGAHEAIWLASDVKKADLLAIGSLPKSFCDLSKYDKMEEFRLAATEVCTPDTQIILPKGIKVLEFNNVSSLPKEFYDLRAYAALEDVNLKNIKFGDNTAYLPERVRRADFSCSSEMNDACFDLRAYTALEEVNFELVKARRGQKVQLPENIRRVNFSYTDWLPKSFFDLSSYKKMKKISLQQVNIRGFLRLPYGIEEANLDSLQGLPEKFDLSWYKRLKKLEMYRVNLTKVKEFILAPNLSELNLFGAENLPWEKFDLSAQKFLKRLNIAQIDLSHYSELKLPPNIEKLVIGEYGGKLPETLDLSAYRQLREIDFSYADFSGVKMLALPKEVQTLNFADVRHLPAAGTDLRHLAALRNVCYRGAQTAEKVIRLPMAMKGKELYIPEGFDISYEDIKPRVATLRQRSGR